MLILTIYDIENDRIRTKISEACKDYGLERIQYSAFLGDLNTLRRDELLIRLRKTLGDYSGNIQLIPLCDKDVRLRKIIDVPKSDTADDADGE
ncbi:MAG TPA: CRISPR-associated endonuclease Cas2 [Candidatus Obscuribacterales bacterium]